MFEFERPRWVAPPRAILQKLGAVLVMAVATATPLYAQFGQNKVTYSRFEWRVYPSPHFDVHYYGAEEIFLEDVISYAESAYLKISKDLDHELRFRVPLIVYKTHGDFEQTNVTLGDVPEGVAAFAEPIQNRMVLPIDLPPHELYQLIAHELAHIFQYSIFYEGYLGRAVRSNAPLWLMEGMASYLAEDEGNIDRMALRDAVVNNILPPIQALDVLTFLTYRYGHAIFDFMEQEHGQEGVRSFIYEFRKVLLTGNIEKAIKESFGYDVDEFNRRFARYLQKTYLPVLLAKKAPEDYGEEIGFEREGVYTFSPTVSPSGELVAVLASPKMELDLVVLSAEDGSKVRNLTRGWTNRYRSLVSEAFSGKRDLSWSPTGDQVAVFVRRENTWPLVLFDALRGRVAARIELPGMVQTASPAFSPDGRKVAFEANRDGIVDIFELDLETRQVRNVTGDDDFDANPWYAPDGKSLVYNRRIGEGWKIFSVDLADPSLKTQLSFGGSSDLQPAYSRDAKRVYFASDRGPEGVFNIHSIDLATGEIRRHTDVVGGCFAPVEMAQRGGEDQLVFVSFFEGTFRLFRMPLRIATEEKAEGAPVPAPQAGAEVVATSGAEETGFEPPLQLRVDEEKKRPYKLKWDIEAPQITAGVANDGTFLSNSSIQFSDLLGDHRVQVVVTSVSNFSNLSATYLNLKRRTHWGATVYDYRDYFVQDIGFGPARDQIQRATGVTGFLQYPFSRYYRLEGALGALDRSQDFLAPTEFGFQFQTVSDRFATGSLSLTGDTTRFQSFGPFQGKRFTLGVFYGQEIGSDIPGDLLEYSGDFRIYKQLTRRSLIAWRAAAVYNAGERETYYPLGGINQLRGFDFRDFFGSRVAWSNLELRFPLVDELRFPFGSLRQLRGFLFSDIGAAWLRDDAWFDPESNFVRTEPKFAFWDTDNDRLQDGRASYGAGFQFFFGGLQFNWSWARRLAHTRFVPVLDPATDRFVLERQEAKGGGTHMDFYIVYDF